MTDIWPVPQKVKPKKPGKRPWSFWRDDKSTPHKTRNGRGIVGQLRKKQK